MGVARRNAEQHYLEETSVPCVRLIEALVFELAFV